MANGEPFVLKHFRLTAEILNLPEFSRDVDPLPARLGPARPPITRHDELPLQACSLPLACSAGRSQAGDYVLGYPPHAGHPVRAAGDEIESREAEAQEVA